MTSESSNERRPAISLAEDITQLDPEELVQYWTENHDFRKDDVSPFSGKCFVVF